MLYVTKSNNKLPGLSARVLILFNWKNGCYWILQLSSAFTLISISDSGEGEENLYLLPSHLCLACPLLCLIVELLSSQHSIPYNVFAHSLASGMNLLLQRPKVSGIIREAQRGVCQNRYQLAD